MKHAYLLVVLFWAPSAFSEKLLPQATRVMSAEVEVMKPNPIPVQSMQPPVVEPVLVPIPAPVPSMQPPQCSTKPAEPWYPSSSELSSLESIDKWEGVYTLDSQQRLIWNYSVLGEVTRVLVNPPAGTNPVLSHEWGGAVTTCRTPDGGAVSTISLWFRVATVFNVLIETSTQAEPAISRTLLVGVDEAGRCGPAKSSWERLMDNHITLTPNDQPAAGTKYDIMTVQADDVTMDNFNYCFGGANPRTKVLNDTIKAIQGAYKGTPIKARITGHGNPSAMDASSTEPISANDNNTKKLALAIQGKVDYVQLLACCVSHNLVKDGNSHVMKYLADTAATSKQAVTVGGYDRPLLIARFPNIMGCGITAMSDTQYLEAKSSPKKEACRCTIDRDRYRGNAQCTPDWEFEETVPANLRDNTKTFKQICESLPGKDLKTAFPRAQYYWQVGSDCSKVEPKNVIAKVESCSYEP